MDAGTLLAAVIADPVGMGVNDRQWAKLRRCLRTIHADDGEALCKATEMGQLRASHADPTVLISNVGSSGSHWVQAMLAHLAPMLPCGEVYFPEPLLDRVAGLSIGEQHDFMQAYYAIHGWNDSLPMQTAAAINTAHKARPDVIVKHDRRARLVLLVRDPVAIVMSRTFRKREYQVAVGHGDTSDAEYLSVNIRFVRDFFQSVKRDEFDVEVRYEGLVRRPFEALSHLSRALGLDATDDIMQEVVDSHSAKRLAKCEWSGNLYTEPRIEPPAALVRQAEAELADIRAAFDYT